MSKIILITASYIDGVVSNRLTVMGKYGPKTPNLVNDRCKVE